MYEYNGYPGEARKRERNVEYSRRWVESNTELNRERKRRWERNNYERTRERFWKEQGISLSWDTFIAMLEQQAYRCAVCSKAIDISASPDHNHVTKAVRGVLCHDCNTALGLVGESVTVLESTIGYLQTSEYHFTSSEAIKQRSKLFRSTSYSIRQREGRWKQQGIDIRYHEFLEVLRTQDYRCAICRCGIDTSAHVDHCKATYVVRGCLCSKCNHAMGLIHDSVTVAASIIDYLNSYS